MNRPARLSAEERRLSILSAAIPLFAKHGFNGATTKQIARAAGISEALLYRHFPSKESMYKELKDFACQGKGEITEFIGNLEPSTSTLVHIIYFMTAAIAFGEGHKSDYLSHDNLHRLLANSYLDSGHFARMFLGEHIHIWEEILDRCFEASMEAGDMLEDWIDTKDRWWFCHHLAVALGFLNLPDEKVIEYGASADKLLDQAVRFCLRGMGMKDEAIKRHYNPSTLSIFVSGISQI